jgi:hypothetical protein
VTPLRRIALIGNSLPRRCGIATFTTDLEHAISTSRPNLETSIVAMTDHGQAYDYPASVALQVKDDSIEEYVRAAAFLNAGRFAAPSIRGSLLSMGLTRSSTRWMRNTMPPRPVSRAKPTPDGP